MKKILLLFVSSLLLCGCGIEQSAKSQMVKSIKKEALDPSSVKISDEEVVFKNDSICVIDFVLRQANRDGEMDKSKMEYSYMQAYDGIYEDFIYIDKRPFKERIKEDLNRDREFHLTLSNGLYGANLTEIDVIITRCKTGDKVK